MDWVREVLLPDLLEKQKKGNRGSIIISARQADCIARVTKVVYSRGIYYREGMWDTRIITIYNQRGTYTLSIGLSQAEQDAIADHEHKKNIERKRDYLARLKAQRPEKYAEEMGKLLSEIADYESFDDRDEWENRHLEELRYIIA